VENDVSPKNCSLALEEVKSEEELFDIEHVPHLTLITKVITQNENSSDVIEISGGIKVSF
jgi:hypothetical protein